MLLVVTAALAAGPTPSPAGEAVGAPGAGGGLAEGPGRPVVGIGAGLRGGAGSAGFVMSVRVRATPWLVLDPMVYVLAETTDGVTTTTSSEQDELLTEAVRYAALAGRLRVVSGRRASGWVLVTGSLLSQDYETMATTTTGGVEGEEEWERYQQLGGTLGAGFSGEVWLRPELTVSGDVGFDVWGMSTTVREVEGADQVETASGPRLSPFVQLALHLYL